MSIRHCNDPPVYLPLDTSTSCNIVGGNLTHPLSVIQTHSIQASNCSMMNQETKADHDGLQGSGTIESGEFSVHALTVASLYTVTFNKFVTASGVLSWSSLGREKLKFKAMQGFKVHRKQSTSANWLALGRHTKIISDKSGGLHITKKLYKSSKAGHQALSLSQIQLCLQKLSILVDPESAMFHDDDDFPDSVNIDDTPWPHPPSVRLALMSLS